MLHVAFKTNRHLDDVERTLASIGIEDIRSGYFEKKDMIYAMSMGQEHYEQPKTLDDFSYEEITAYLNEQGMH